MTNTHKYTFQGQEVTQADIICELRIAKTRLKDDIIAFSKKNHLTKKEQIELINLVFYDFDIAIHKLDESIPFRTITPLDEPK